MKRVLVLGGGFGGGAAAQRLDRALRHEADVEIVLVSLNNFQTYTPMLADVAGGTIEPRHAVPALRAFLEKAKFQEAVVEAIDVPNQTVHLSLINGQASSLAFDYLVIALGAVTSFSHATGAGEHALGLKTFLDAFRLRNRALTLLEWADTIQDPARRRALLTFVFAGGGFSGVEGIAALEDLLHGALRYYPNIHHEELRFILAPHGTRLLEEIDPRLGEYTVKKLRKRGIDVRLGVGVSAVTQESATLTTGEVIPSHTVVWTAGIKVNPVLHDTALPKNAHGALQVNSALQVTDHPVIFALGDCAAVPTPDDQGFYAPTAQNAIRQGPVAAANIVSMIRGSAPAKTFHYKPMGSLASLGQRQAVAQMGKLHFSGLPAWFAWRGIYLAKLPHFGQKVRVSLDWLTDLFAPVDTTQIPIIRENMPVVLASLEGNTQPTFAPPISPPIAPASTGPDGTDAAAPSEPVAR